MKYDAVIIGGGMAGLLSSIHLAEKGWKTAVLSKGDPVCSISTGCIDLANDFDAIPEDHPYKKEGKAKVEQSLNRFMELMKKADLPYSGKAFENRLIYTPVARKRETCLVPLSMEEAHGVEHESIHIITFKGMKDFFPHYFSLGEGGQDVSVYDCGVKTTIGIATHLDDSESRKDFITWLRGLAIDEDVIALPAVLGTENPRSFMEEIKEATGKKVFEIPTLPPSMPGLRLFRAMKRYASSNGVDFFWGNAITDYRASDNRIESLIIDQPGRPIVIEGRSFILATGSFVSGGLFAEKNGVKETVFDLPVSMPEGQQRLNDTFFDPGHPIGKAGIKINRDYRPADSDLTNLFAGGSILENSSVMKYNCGHGMAIVTAYGAAENCEEYLK